MEYFNPVFAARSQPISSRSTAAIALPVWFQLVNIFQLQLQLKLIIYFPVTVTVKVIVIFQLKLQL